MKEKEKKQEKRKTHESRKRHRGDAKKYRVNGKVLVGVAQGIPTEYQRKHLRRKKGEGNEGFAKKTPQVRGKRDRQRIGGVKKKRITSLGRKDGSPWIDHITGCTLLWDTRRNKNLEAKGCGQVKNKKGGIREPASSSTWIGDRLGPGFRRPTSPNSLAGGRAVERNMR